MTFYFRLNEMYADVTNALSSNVKPADIGSIYRVYQDFSTLRTLKNAYVGEEGETSPKGKKYPAKFYSMNKLVFLNINCTYST